MKKLSPLLVLALMACGHKGGSHGMEVKAGDDAFHGSDCGLSVKPLDFSGMMVGKSTEAEYLAGKSADDQQKFQKEKDGASDEWLKGVMNNAAPFAKEASAKTPYVAVAHVKLWEPGTYAGPWSKNAHMNVTFQVQDPSGQVLEQFSERINPNSGWLTATESERMGLGGRVAGEVFGRYIQKRFQCGK